MIDRSHLKQIMLPFEGQSVHSTFKQRPHVVCLVNAQSEDGFHIQLSSLLQQNCIKLNLKICVMSSTL